MLDLIGQMAAYAAVGIVILVIGFFVLDLLTPGRLGQQIADGNKGAAMVASSLLVSIGLVQWFAMFFTGAGWSGLDDAIVFGIIGVAIQAIGFLLLDLIVPGKLGAHCVQDGDVMHPSARVVSAMHIAVAVIVCASLT